VNQVNSLAGREPGARPSAMDVDGYRELLRPLFAGRRVVLTGGAAQGHVAQVRALRDLGSDRCLVIGGRGTGPLPPEEDADVVLVDVSAPDMVAEIRTWDRLHADPPPHVVEALDRFDADGDGLLLLTPFDTAKELAGRRSWGARPPEWTALEDKTRADALCDRAGVVRPPSEVVPVALPELRRAAARLDIGSGTVWAGDASDGFNGGAVCVHWVRDDDDAEAAAAALAPRCRTARVAPFLEGVPCSIHGFVTGDGVAALRPVELVTLRSARRPRLRYAGTATVWDPPEADREAMREAARRIGAALRAEVSLRGFFTVDGVLTADGFRPTEVNPRFGAGLLGYAASAPELSLPLLHRATIAGAIDPAAADVEALLVPAADATRVAASWMAVPGRRIEEEGEAELPGGTKVMVGPGPMGAFVRVTFDVPSLPAGAPVAPAAVAALGVADERFDLGIGPLEPAVPVR
jgi:hypothetical protein